MIMSTGMMYEFDETDDMSTPDTSWNAERDNEDSNWNDPTGDAGDTIESCCKEDEESEVDVEESAAMKFWSSNVLEADASDFIEPTKSGVDETKPQINPENDNYEGNPATDKGADDLMKDDDSTTEIEMESFLF